MATPPDHALSFLAFARVFSGTIRKGQKLYALHPRYNPSHVTDPALLDTPPGESPELLPDHASLITAENLYLLMGRDVVEAESIAAGNVVGIGGLEGVVVKSATLSSTLSCTAFRSLNLVTHPIVHVAIEPVHYSDMSSLLQGLKLLNQSDPCIKLTLQETGEHILSATGEVHLQRCLDDLRNTYARAELKVSPPVVPFRETIVAPPTVDMVNEVISSENESNQRGGVDANPVMINIPGNKFHSLTLVADPLPDKVVKLLDENSHLLKLLVTSVQQLDDDVLQQLKQLYSELKSSFEADDPKKWGGAIDQIWSFGPRHNGPNVLLNKVPGYRRASVWGAVSSGSEGGVAPRENDNSIVNGFQLASLAGPLCDEPLRGVCVSVLDWTTPTDPTQAEETSGSISGQLISVAKEGCRQAILAQPTRLMIAMYSCIIQVGVAWWVQSRIFFLFQAASSVLSFVYAVIGRRNGRVLSEEMVEGSDLFIIHSLVPVAESFGFCDEFRKQTVGQANPQLIFSHWEVR